MFRALRRCEFQMSLWLRIGIELALLFALSKLGNAFWSLQKSPRLFRMALKQTSTIQGAIERANANRWHKSKRVEMGRVNQMFSVVSSPAECMLFLESYVRSAHKAWSFAKFPLLAIALVMIGGSYFVSAYAAGLNLLLFLAVGRLFDPSPDAIAEVLGSLQIVVAIMQKSLARFPSECAAYCSEESSSFSTVFSVLNQSEICSAH